MGSGLGKRCGKGSFQGTICARCEGLVLQRLIQCYHCHETLKGSGLRTVSPDYSNPHWGPLRKLTGLAFPGIMPCGRIAQRQSQKFRLLHHLSLFRGKVICLLPQPTGDYTPQNLSRREYETSPLEPEA
jgi:hypothetical protein